MENSKINVVRSELNMACSYIDRLFHGIIDLSDLDYHPELKKLINPFYQKISKILNVEVFQLTLAEMDSGVLISPIKFREWISEVFNSLEVITRLGFKDSLIAPYLEIINTGYRLGRELHLFCLRETDLVVELPRMVGSQEVKQDQPPRNLQLTEFLTTADELDDEIEDWDEHTFPFYQVSQKSISESEFGGSILSFSMGTLKKSKNLINKGHECVFEKKYSNALVFFEKSRRLYETAEVLTLIGWVYSLIDNFDRAKKFCLKAIEIDPDYGPAYNDIGSYLLQEGDISESIRWFNLAKNSPIYQNKEYPYINTGRALLMQKKYRQALDEFKKARKIAPHQRQIGETISKIEKLMAPTNDNDQSIETFPFKPDLNKMNEFELELQ